MKAMIVDKKSKEKSLTAAELPTPVPGQGQVLIRIRATGLNAADWRSVQLGMVPKSGIMGADVAGTVEATGPGAQSFKPGDRVFGDLSGCGFGGLAEYVAVPESALIPIPPALDFVQAASLPLAAVTALQALRHQGGLQSGEEVLLIGASGGVGSYALRLCCHMGALVSAVCSGKRREAVLAAGARRVFDYQTEDFSKDPARYDLILGIQGNHSLLKLRRLLKDRGRFILVGGSLSQVFRTMIFGPLLSLGRRKLILHMAKPSGTDLAFCANLAVSGVLGLKVETFGLKDSPAAFDKLRQGHVEGKLVMVADLD